MEEVRKMELINGRMRISDKALIIIEKLMDTNGVDLAREDEAREKSVDAVIKALEEIEEIEEETRTLSEIHEIVKCVRQGVPVRVAYYDQDEDDDEGMISYACW